MSETPNRRGFLLPESLPDNRVPHGVDVHGVIWHWSEGHYIANDTDLEHYHFLVEYDVATARASIALGNHNIWDNQSTQDGNYAAHTRGCNTGWVGIALCGMVGCQEQPLALGAEPIQFAQVELMCRLTAHVLEAYHLKVSRTTCLGHGEVQSLLGIWQRGKWDPMAFQWLPGKSYREVGDYLRSLTATFLEKPANVNAYVFKKQVPKELLSLEDGVVRVPLRQLSDLMGWKVVSVGAGGATIQAGGKVYEVEMELRGQTGFVTLRDLAYGMGAPLAWDATTRTAKVG